MGNKLPFLHTQVLEFVYNKISNQDYLLDTSELSEETGYPPDSKIIQNALITLNAKGFLTLETVNILNQKNTFRIGVPEQNMALFHSLTNKKNTVQRFKPSIEFHDYFRTYQTGTHYQFALSNNKLESLNNGGIVHKWYNYLEEFSFQFTWNYVQKYCTSKRDIVLDPFSGSGTTLVTAKIAGHDAIGIDANPLMCFVSRMKTTWDIDLPLFKDSMVKLNNEMLKDFSAPASYKVPDDFLSRMPKRELNQWLSPVLQRQINFTKQRIQTISNSKVRDLFLLAMAKSAFDGSYVALCPGTTFYPYREKRPFYELFIKKLNQIYYDLNLLSKMDHYGSVKVVNGDARDMSKLVDRKVKLSITSPPYPNDLEYTRQTRLELYLLDFVKDMTDIQNLKKTMVKGSTKLIFKESNSAKFVENNKLVNEIADKIAYALRDKNWGFDYPRMIREYFGDMYLNLKAHLDILTDHGTYVLVVGDQTYKQIVIPVGKILADMGKEVGYSASKVELHRMRRSTTHNIPLPEETVILSK